MSNIKGPHDLEWWVLDFSLVEDNEQVRAQGVLVCLRTPTKGFFSPDLERYPTRQDLAKKARLSFYFPGPTFP